jgi:hypothetical protein
LATGASSGASALSLRACLKAVTTGVVAMPAGICMSGEIFSALMK